MISDCDRRGRRSLGCGFVNSDCDRRGSLGCGSLFYLESPIRCSLFSESPIRCALRSIVNAEKRGKATVELKPISNVISSFLKITKDRGKSVLFPLFADMGFLCSSTFSIASIKISHLYFWIPLLFEIVVGCIN